MPDFLRVNSEALKVLEGTFRLEQHERLGATDRTADATLVTSERSPKHAFSCQALWDTAEEYEAFLAGISVSSEPGIPTEVAVDSDAQGATQGDLFQMLIWMTGAEPFIYLDGGVEISYWITSIHFRQV